MNLSHSRSFQSHSRSVLGHSRSFQGHSSVIIGSFHSQCKVNPRSIQGQFKVYPGHSRSFQDHSRLFQGHSRVIPGHSRVILGSFQGHKFSPRSVKVSYDHISKISTHKPINGQTNKVSYRAAQGS